MTREEEQELERIAQRLIREGRMPTPEQLAKALYQTALRLRRGW
jgi:hypothetical protein